MRLTAEEFIRKIEIAPRWSLVMSDVHDLTIELQYYEMGRWTTYLSPVMDDWNPLAIKLFYVILLKTINNPAIAKQRL